MFNSKMNNFVATLAIAVMVSACGGASQASSSVPAPENPGTGTGTGTGTGSVTQKISIPLKNPSFDGNQGERFVDWQAHEHNSGNSYTFTADTVDAYSAPSSLRINRYGPEVYGRLDQRLRIDPSWINKTLRLSAFLKSAGIDGTGGALVIQSTNGGGDILAWNNMDSQRVLGTQPWKNYSIDLKIPQGSYFLIAGVMLEGGGTLWADDITLELVD